MLRIFGSGKAKAGFEEVLKRHFGSEALDSLVTTTRVFPITARPDLQQSLNATFSVDFKQEKLLGIHQNFSHSTLSIADLITAKESHVNIAPLQYDDVEVGGELPIRCVKQAIWLSKSGRLPFAVLLSQESTYGRSSGLHLEIAVPPGEAGVAFTREFNDALEKKVNSSGSYRGRVLSLEKTTDYSGKASAVKVHRLRSVTREQVILPEKTLRLLERNVGDFIQNRAALKRLGMPLKKGLLFYGPPGTGKTHTIHYLANQIPHHTTFLINAEQVGLLDNYMQLARFMQPALIVIEDADLIARARTTMGSPCEESLLNRLLNEMDGLREDAELLFILTTNRPEELEPALSARPGRIDQAIEFPLPDPAGRSKLVELYAGNLRIRPELKESMVGRTEGASAAFIKELMRRSAQYAIQSGNEGDLSESEIASALDEMLFSGGSLNHKLLGVKSSKLGFSQAGAPRP